MEAHFGASIRVSGKTGRSSSFEVSCSIATGAGEASAPVLAHSKLASHDFPDKNAIIAKIQRWAATGKME